MKPNDALQQVYDRQPRVAGVTLTSAANGVQYRLVNAETVQRVIPKVRGKAARRAGKRARRTS